MPPWLLIGLPATFVTLLLPALLRAPKPDNKHALHLLIGYLDSDAEQIGSQLP